MKIKIIAADSLGVRSMATFIDAYGGILIDGSASLAPKRYFLPPSKIELEALDSALKEIYDYLSKARYVVISHYHYDHYLPDESYEGKVLFVKNPKENINRSQRLRAKRFLEQCKAEVHFGEPLSLEEFGIDGEISPAMPHGEDNSRLGFVFCTRIEDFVHCSDVQGFTSKKPMEWLLEINPKTVFLSGFPTYLTAIVGKEAMERSIENFIEFLDKTGAKEIIVDHHLLRDKNFPERIRKVLEKAGDVGIEIKTASEFEKKPARMLEAFRNLLHKGEEEKAYEESEKVVKKAKEIRTSLQ